MVYERGASIEPGVKIYPGAYIGRGVVLGRNTIIHSGAHIENATIGANCVINANAVIGKDGFGYTFIGWDKEFSEVKGNLVVNAQFEALVYNIKYYNGTQEITIPALTQPNTVFKLRNKGIKYLNFPVDNNKLSFAVYIPNFSLRTKYF